jgi:ppGpp synthetase/RelA/SpoT-type nucleotidyltranferase
MTKQEVEKFYINNQKLFSRLAENTKQALQTFLEAENISYHSISFRIKKFDSYFEKIERKGYDNPFEQIEDFCGLRIICFYPYDLEKIAKIINSEFEVIESIDKSANLEPDRFGYRSNHYIVRVKKDWLNAPNYRGLEDLKAEIQVRTILMHSWADIEHKLAYKNKEDIPVEFSRKLYQLSALLEIADSQFQELKNDKENFKSSLIISKKGGDKIFDVQSDLNLDSFQAYLDFTFPNRNNQEVDGLFRQVKKLKISLADIEKFRKETEEIIPEIEKEILRDRTWPQVGIIRAILDLKSDVFWNNRPKEWAETNWGKVISEWRKKIEK